MKYITKFEKILRDTKDYKSGDLVVIKFNNNIAKFAYQQDKKYIIYSLFDDKTVYQLPFNQIRKPTAEELEQYNLDQSAKKYNI